MCGLGVLTHNADGHRFNRHDSPGRRVLFVGHRTTFLLPSSLPIGKFWTETKSDLKDHTRSSWRLFPGRKAGPTLTSSVRSARIPTTLTTAIKGIGELSPPRAGQFCGILVTAGQVA